MRELVEHIVNKNFDAANETIAESFDLIMRKKLVEMKKIVRARDMDEQNLAMNKRYPNASSKVRAGINEDDMDKFDDDKQKPEPKKAKMYRHDVTGKEIVHTGTPPEGYKLVREEDLTEQQRFKIVKARVRGGKVERRRKVSNVPGFTFRSGKLTRMSPQERRRRKLGQRKGKIKRKSKLRQSLMKRRRAMIKRRAIGLR